MKHTPTIITLTLAAILGFIGLGSHSGTPDPMCPIGSIIAWHNGMSYPGGQANAYLPSGWVVCDGSTLHDKHSPFDGQVIPDLNNTKTFLRGLSTATAGPTGGAETHSHTYFSVSDIEDGDQDYVLYDGAAAGAGLTDVVGPAYAHLHNVSGTTDASSNLPPYMDVAWIMRVK